VRKCIDAGEELDDRVLGKEYKVARRALAHAQALKCCYCEERQQSVKWKHVEHYRPRSSYWWLSWTWDNLLFACEQCNTSKGPSFPLAPESTRLTTGERPPGNESPLLIHPAREDPREHIQFIPAANFWFPRPRDDSARGRETLRALGCADIGTCTKPGLLENWRQHAAGLQSCVSAIESAIESNDADLIRRVWTRRTTRFRVARNEYVALALDVLDRSFPEHVRRRWGLALDVIDEP
jgi:uncharacterized protein (TIGR02646 family)